MIYVFVRQDLTRPQQVVQAAHAVAESVKAVPYGEEHPTIIVYGVKSLKKLEGVLGHLDAIGVLYKQFLEPDRPEKDQLTAIATTVQYDRIDEFRKYQLLK